MQKKPISITTYSYQLNDQTLNFDQGVKILREYFPNRVFVGYPEITYSKEENEALLSDFKQKGIECCRYNADRQEYLSYLIKARYTEKYPSYYDFNFDEKTFEHFIAFHLLNLKKDDNFIDIAAEHSPHAEIFHELTGCNGYMQDIMFEPGVHGNKIGSDASKLPLPGKFFKGVLAACSIEHFENNTDILFMKEVSRILDNGGRVVILPLYLHKIPACITDPRYSIPGNVKFDDNINIHCVESFGNRHARFYSVETLYKRLIEPNLGKMKFRVYYIENFREIHKSIYCRFVLFCERAGGPLDRAAGKLKRLFGSGIRKAR